MDFIFLVVEHQLEHRRNIIIVVKLFTNAIKEMIKEDNFIWGGCMGMQQLMIIADGKNDLENLLQFF